MAIGSASLEKRSQTRATRWVREEREVRACWREGRECLTVSFICVARWMLGGRSWRLTWGRMMESMLGGRVFRISLVEGVGGPSVGMRIVTWKLGCSRTSLLENSTIGIKWLRPGQGIMAMHVFLSMVMGFIHNFGFCCGDSFIGEKVAA